MKKGRKRRYTKNVYRLKNKKPTKYLPRLLKSFTFVRFQSVIRDNDNGTYILKDVFMRIPFSFESRKSKKLGKGAATKASTWYDYITFLLTNEQLASRSVYHTGVGSLALLILRDGNARAKKKG